MLCIQRSATNQCFSDRFNLHSPLVTGDSWWNRLVTRVVSTPENTSGLHYEGCGGGVICTVKRQTRIDVQQRGAQLWNMKRMALMTHL